MILGDTMTYFFVVLGFLLALPGLWLLCRGLWPNVVQHATDDCMRGLLFPFLVGLPLAVTAFFATIAASKGLGGASGFVSIAIVCLFIFFASTGIAGLTTSIGMKLPSPADADRPWKATIRGSVVLELAILLPLLGWFLILPSAIIIGAGSALRAIITNFRNKPSKVKSIASNGKAKADDVVSTPIIDGSDMGLGGSLGAA